MRSIADIFRSYAVLDAQGRHMNGTDKQSNHNYGDAYERIITEAFGRTPYVEIVSETARNNVGLVMEVGVADGSCLLAWREVFPNAIVVGMDIHPSDKAHGDRIEFHLGDQRVQADCDRAAAGRQFDMIVDDATHQLEDTLRTMLYLWRYVKLGGLYVIEEFPNVGALRHNIMSMWPGAEIIDTVGPFGGVEPLVAIRRLS